MNENEALTRRSGPVIPILFEDNHLLVIEKPVNIPTQEDASGDLDLLNALKADIKERFLKPGNVYLGLVHRLDRPVGGAMVFAKTSKAASRLSDSIRTRAFDKRYVAIVHGEPEAHSDTLVHYLIKDNQKNKVASVSPNTAQAKKAVLDYTILGSDRKLSLISIQLHTGRPHQIRVQLTTIGHPLYGDQKYGAHLNTPGQQIALWSTQLEFIHPVTKELMSFQSLPPQVEPWSRFHQTLFTS